MNLLEAYRCLCKPCRAVMGRLGVCKHGGLHMEALVLHNTKERRKCERGL